MELAARIAAIASGFSGTLGVAAANLTTGEQFGFQESLSFYPASTIKLPLLYTLHKGALEGRWSLDDRLTLNGANMVEGSGVLLDLTPGLELRVRDVATLMITISDNTATNMLIDLVTPEAVNAAMADLGIEGVRLNRKIGLQLEIPLGEATALGMARLMALIAEQKVLDPISCRQIIDVLKRQKYKELTSRYIPETDAEDGDPLVRVASKSGWIRGVRNDVALIWAPRATYVLSMFSRDCRDRRFYHDNEGSLALARVSEAFYLCWGR